MSSRSVGGNPGALQQRGERGPPAVRVHSEARGRDSGPLHNAQDPAAHLQETLDDGSFQAMEQGVWVNHEDVKPVTGEVEDKGTSGWLSTTVWCSAPAGTTTSRETEREDCSLPTLHVQCKGPHAWTRVPPIWETESVHHAETAHSLQQKYPRRPRRLPTASGMVQARVPAVMGGDRPSNPRRSHHR